MIVETTDYIEAVHHLPQNGTLLLHNVSWEEYGHVLKQFEQKPAYCVYYNNGVLKIMSPRLDHEFPKDVAFTAVRIYADEFDVDVDGYGSTTWRQKRKAKGAEADTSFYVKNAAKVRGVKDFDLNLQIPPDIVVEVDISNESWDKFDIYAGLGVPELWRCNGTTFQIYTLFEGKYEAVGSSESLPLITGNLLTEYLQIGREKGQTLMAKELRNKLRELK